MPAAATTAQYVDGQLPCTIEGLWHSLGVSTLYSHPDLAHSLLGLAAGRDGKAYMQSLLEATGWQQTL